MINERTSLLPMMTVAQNLFLFGQTGGRRRFFAHEKENIHKTRRLLEDWEIPLDPCLEVGRLSIGEQHVLETVKAVLNGAELILYDEAAAFYNEGDYEILKTHLKRLRARGITVVYADSKLKPMMEICDRIFLIRYGRGHGVYYRDEFSETRFGSLLAEDFGEVSGDQEADRSVPVIFRAILSSAFGEPMEIQIGSGEIVGYVEEDENRLKSAAEALTGLCRNSKVSVWLDGKKVDGKRDAQAHREGVRILYGCEDRHHLFPNFSVGMNYCVPVLDRVRTSLGFVRPKLVQYLFEKEVKDERLARHSSREEVCALDVDERVALYLERLLLGKPKVILIYHFGRGIDFISRHWLFRRITEECKKGTAFLLLSNNELDLEGICERVYRGKSCHPPLH